MESKIQACLGYPYLGRVVIKETKMYFIYTFSNLICALPSTSRQINTPTLFHTFLNGKDPYHKGRFNFFLLLFQLNFDITCINSEEPFFLHHSSLYTDAPLPSEKNGERDSLPNFFWGEGGAYTEATSIQFPVYLSVKEFCCKDKAHK